MFEGFFTEEQVKGTLESYKKLEDGKEQAIANLQSRKSMMDKKGKQNNKAIIKEEVKTKQVAIEIVEESKQT